MTGVARTSVSAVRFEVLTGFSPMRWQRRLFKRFIDAGLPDARDIPTACDVSRHLGVAKDSIYRWIESLSLPAHRVGRLWKFGLNEVDEWVREGGADAADVPDGVLAPKRGGHR